jgi:hypothetical protein
MLVLVAVVVVVVVVVVVEGASVRPRGDSSCVAIMVPRNVIIALLDVILTDSGGRQWSEHQMLSTQQGIHRLPHPIGVLKEHNVDRNYPMVHALSRN